MSLRNRAGRFAHRVARRLSPPQPAAVPMPAAAGRSSLANITHHAAPLGLPAARIASAPVVVGGAERQAAQRVLRAYTLALEEQKQVAKLPASDVWATAAPVYHAEMASVLGRGDVDEIAAYLAEAYRKDVTHGLGPGRLVYEAALTPEGVNIAMQCVDQLVTLAEAIGILPYENPEQGRWGVNLYLDPSDVFSQIETALGADLLPNQGMGYFGIPLARGLFFVRSADAIYLAWRTQQLGAKRVTEIGGGLAATGDYALRLGARTYRVYDLPITGAIQGFALILAGHPVSLLGEAEAAAVVRPWWHFETAPSCDIVINQDSFPEIDSRFVLGYLRRIRDISSQFLSINQEGAGPANGAGDMQHVVGHLVSRVPGFRRVSRSLHWLRRGYVEELYDTPVGR